MSSTNQPAAPTSPPAAVNRTLTFATPDLTPTTATTTATESPTPSCNHCAATINASLLQFAKDQGWNPTQPSWNDAAKELARANGYGPMNWNAATRRLALDNGYRAQPPGPIWDEATRNLARANGYEPATPITWNAETQQLARTNGYGPMTWNAETQQLARNNGYSAPIDEVPQGQPIFPPVLVKPNRTADQEVAYLNKGCKRRTATNQKPAGAVKVHYGRRTFPRGNRNIRMQTLQVRRSTATTRPSDVIYLPATSRPTDQVRIAEYMATAMNDVPVIIHGHRIHHETIMNALDAHAQACHAMASNAMSMHDTNTSAAANGFAEP